MGDVPDATSWSRSLIRRRPSLVHPLCDGVRHDLGAVRLTHVGLFASLGEPDDVSWLNTPRASRLRVQVERFEQSALPRPGEDVLRGDLNFLDLQSRMSTRSVQRRLYVRLEYRPSTISSPMISRLGRSSRGTRLYRVYHQPGACRGLHPTMRGSMRWAVSTGHERRSGKEKEGRLTYILNRVSGLSEPYYHPHQLLSKIITAGGDSPHPSPPHTASPGTSRASQPPRPPSTPSSRAPPRPA
jgi:hypothetical protein